MQFNTWVNMKYLFLNLNKLVCLSRKNLFLFFNFKIAKVHACLKLSSCMVSDNIALPAVQEACRNNIYIAYAYLSICSWPRQICIYGAKAFLKATL